MFINNADVTLLYDVIFGGPPQAFMCKHCDALFKTEFGVSRHLQFKHGIKEQECIFSMESPIVNPSEQALEKYRKFARVLQKQKPPKKAEIIEMNGNVLQKPTLKES